MCSNSSASIWPILANPLLLFLTDPVGQSVSDVLGGAKFGGTGGIPDADGWGGGSRLAIPFELLPIGL